MLDIAVAFLIGIGVLVCGLAVYLIALGPSRADRVVALEILLAGAIALAIGATLQFGRTVFLDVAIGLALVGFVATIGWARLLDRSATVASALADPSPDRKDPR